MGFKAFAIALALLPSAVMAQPLQPTKEDVAEAVTSSHYASYPERDVEAFHKDLRSALGQTNLDAAADQLGAKYGLQSSDIRQFVRAWVMVQAHHYDDDEKWAPAVRGQLYDVVPKLRTTRVGLALLAETLDDMEDCSADDFNRLMAGSTDPATDAYVIANHATCVANFARAAAVDRDRAMPALIRQAGYGGLPPRDRLPLYAWLTRPETLARVREADRPALATMLWQRYLSELFAAGLDRQALATFDALPDDLRKAVISPRRRPTFDAVVDGVLMSFEEDRYSGFNDLDGPTLQIVEAMAIADRKDEARALLATLPGLAEAKAALTCEYARKGNRRAKCPDAREAPMAALPVDHLLNSPDADPYPIAETTLSGMGFGGGASKAVLCRVFPRQDYPDVCPEESLEKDLDDTNSDEAELNIARAAIEQAVPNFGALRSSILGGADKASSAKDSQKMRQSVAAVTPGFIEKPIPAEFTGEGKPPEVKGLTPLPRGFQPVRVERAGQRVIAISVSQTYDPSGEVSQGGYWVHVSEDGGKHWGVPLYTGLADRFPYVVKATSRLPMIVDDTLQLAVDVAEIDTASITYPPVALGTRRDASDLYLSIPLEALRRDSDRDGLTDIAEHHLLLDGAAGSTPFIVGSDYDSDCRVAPSDEKLAFLDLLSRFSGGSEAAIIEPVNRPPGQIGMGWSSASAAVDQPVFLIGDRQDYSCLASKRLIIVYSPAEIEAMKAFTPDFRALEMPRIVFNRARDRGYVSWSTGWTGGTFGLYRAGGKWRFFEISSWIT